MVDQAINAFAEDRKQQQVRVYGFSLDKPASGVACLVTRGPDDVKDPLQDCTQIIAQAIWQIRCQWFQSVPESLPFTAYDEGLRLLLVLLLVIRT